MDTLWTITTDNHSPYSLEHGPESPKELESLRVFHRHAGLPRLLMRAFIKVF